MVVKNGGSTASGPFRVLLSVDGAEVGDVQVADLEAGKAPEVRFDNVGLGPGERNLSDTIDAKAASGQADELKVTARCKEAQR